MTPSENRWAVFLDIDGTIIDRITIFGATPRLKKAIDALHEKGSVVFINTGRLYYSIPEGLLDTADFDGVVSGVGSCITCRGEMIYRALLPDDLLRRVLKLSRAYGKTVIFETFDPACRSVSCGDPGWIGSALRIDDPEECFHEVKARKTSKVLFPYYLQGELRRELERDFCMAYVDQEEAFSEGALIGNDKGTGIFRVCDHFGIPYVHTMAVGDSENDLPMLRAASLPTAMGNASDEVKAACRYVTDSVENDGAAKALEYLLTRL